MASKRGAVAESVLITRALDRGRDVLVPVAGLSPAYDCVVRDVDGAMLKVQVKRAHVRVRNGVRSLRVNVTNSQGKPYTPSEVDVVAIVDVPTNRVWFIPIEDLGTQLTVAVSSSRYDEWLL